MGLDKRPVWGGSIYAAALPNPDVGLCDGGIVMSECEYAESHCDTCGEHYGKDDMNIEKIGNEIFKTCHNCFEATREELKEEFGL